MEGEMKKLFMAGGALALAASGALSAAEPGTEMGAMSYVQIALDGGGMSRKPVFGMALARGEHRPAEPFDLMSAPRMMDMRMSEGQVNEIWLNRLKFASRDKETGRLNAFGDVDDASTWVVGGLAVFGILCVTETWICEDNSSSTPAPE
jgi:hypothetical protein